MSNMLLAITILGATWELNDVRFILTKSNPANFFPDVKNHADIIRDCIPVLPGS